MQIVIDIPEARFRDIQRIADIQLEMCHFQTAEQIIAKGVPIEQEPKWIPVSEGMPKVTDYYLIQHTRKYCNDEMAVAFYSVEEAHVDPNYTWEFVTHSDVQEVIAWMPLPKKYEPQESEVNE